MRKGVKLCIELKMVSLELIGLYDISMWFMVRYVVRGHGCWLSELLLLFSHFVEVVR